MGYNVTAGLGIKPPLAPIGLRLEGALNQMDWKNTSSGSTRLLAGIANVTLSGPALPMGYLIGGVGMYNASASDVTPKPPSETKVGFNVGAGINFPLTGIGTFLEARLHYIKTEGSSFKIVPITFGIKF
jgi:opacity protein-like surface antigen